VLYLAKIFLLFGGIGALGIVERIIYGGQGLGSMVSELTNILLILCSLFLFWSGTRKTKVVRFNRFIPLMAASIPLISVVWSVVPSVTITQGTAYFFAVLGAIGLAETSDGDELMDLVYLVCILSAVASLGQLFIFPDPPEADFRGIFSQKNVLGQVMVGGVIAGMHGLRLKRGRSFRQICGLALCIIVGFMSKSGTSIFAICTLFWIDILGRLYLKSGAARRVATCLAVGSIPVVIFFAIDSELILDALGKDLSLTGRTLFWPYVVDAVGERPILGWGFCAFWSPLNPRSMEIAIEVARGGWVFVIPNAHNGILELLLELGVTGTAFFIFIWLRTLTLALKCLRGSGGQFAISTLMVLMSILQIGVTEEVLVASQQIWTVLFFATGMICEKQLWLERRLARRAWSGQLARV
jgi:O-antigen ligase